MDQIIQQLEAHVNDEKFFSARALRQLSNQTGINPSQLAQGLAVVLALYLEFGKGAFFVANSLLIAYPFVATYVYPEERPARDLLLVYWGCFGLLSAFDRFLEAVPFYYVLKMCLLALFFLEPCSFAEKINKLIEVKLEENNMLTPSELRLIQRKTGRSPVPEKPVDLYDDKKSKDPPKGDDAPAESAQSGSPNKKVASLTPQTLGGIPPAAPPAEDPSMKTARLPVSDVKEDGSEMKTARLPVTTESQEMKTARLPVTDDKEVKTARLPVSAPSDDKEMKTARLPVTSESQRMKTARLPVTVKSDDKEMKTARLPVTSESQRMNTARLPMATVSETQEMKTARLPVTSESQRMKTARLPVTNESQRLKTARLPVTTVSETQEIKTARLPVTTVSETQEMKTARLPVSAPPPDDKSDVKTAVLPTPVRKRQNVSVYALDVIPGAGRTDGCPVTATASDVNIMARDSSYRLRTDGIDNKDIGPASNLHDLILWPRDQLVFNAPFNHENLTYHMVMMNNSQHRMAYAIKGNAIPRIIAYPAHGILKPKTKTVIAVTVKAFDWNEFDFLKDRICWEYVLLKEDDKTEKFNHRLLQQCEWKRRKNIKIVYNV